MRQMGGGGGGNKVSGEKGKREGEGRGKKRLTGGKEERGAGR